MRFDNITNDGITLVPSEVVGYVQADLEHQRDSVGLNQTTSDIMSFRPKLDLKAPVGSGLTTKYLSFAPLPKWCTQAIGFWSWAKSMLECSRVGRTKCGLPK